MQISLKWINDYVNIENYFSKPQELADLLTNTGLEVEEVSDLGKRYASIVIGQILKLDKHPDADRLTVCQVETGSGSVQQIVCGAKNHKQGDKVMVALPGAVLPGDFAIKQSVIRGVESSGMLCSEKELGLSEESSGIMILPEDAPVGEKFSLYKGLDDILFELKVTPNRADCLSHFGLARELSNLLSLDLRYPENELQVEAGLSTKECISLEVKDAENCPRYAGRFIEGVKVAPSPAWLRTRVEAIGLNSINNVVDVTNYVMMEMGQPLHAFDQREIKGNSILVDKAQAGEKFTSLDGTEYTLDGSELVIRDQERPVALAGVVGGKNSGVQDDTTNLFIECAYFKPESVRKTSRKLGIETDSAYRFSRGVDPSGISFVLDRCCHLIQKLAGGKLYGDIHDFYPKGLEAKSFLVSSDYISQRLGMPVDDESFEKALAQLKLKPVKEGQSYRVTAPLYRVDIERKEDIVEEYARLHSYDAIPEKMPELALEPTPHEKDYELQRSLREFLVGQNFTEALNYNFENKLKASSLLGDLDKLKAYGITANPEPVQILNPLNEDFSVMRTSLLPGLMKNVEHNFRYGRHKGQLFEIGYAFGRDSKFGQDPRLAFAAWGETLDLWTKKEKAPLVLQLKESIESLLKELRAKSWSWKQEADAPDFLHPGRSAALFFEGKIIGFVGELHPRMKEALKTKEPIVFAELQLDALLRGQPKAFRVGGVSRMQMVERDLAFVCDGAVRSDSIIDLIKKSSGKLLKEVYVYDQFEGGSLKEGQKSLTFRMYFQDENETLEEKQLSALQEKIIQTVSSKLGVNVR